MPRGDLDDLTEYVIKSKMDENGKRVLDKYNNHIRNLENKPFHFAKVGTGQEGRYAHVVLPLLADDVEEQQKCDDLS